MFMRLGVFLTAASLLLVAGAGQARVYPASMPPHQDSRSTPELESKSRPAEVMELLNLLNCVNALAAGHIAEGERACSDAIALNKNDSNAYKLRGYGYLLESRFERAEADFRTSLRIKPRDAESLAGFGESLSGQGKFDLAVVQFGKAIALAPTSAAYWNGRCWARAGGGRQLGRALADCNHALALAPKSVGVLNSRGLVRLRMGQYQAAIADYSLALAARQGQPSAWFGRGLARMRLGQSEAGTADIVTARRGDPHIDTLFVLMGVLPADCAMHPLKANCPPAPAAPAEKPGRPWILASWRMDGDDDGFFAIEVGRLNVMLDQVAILLQQPPKRLEALPEGDSPKALRASLSNVAARFGQLQPLACRSGRVPASSCAAPYHLVLTGYDDPSQAVEELYGHIRPVWAGLCAGHKKSCQLE